MDCGHGIEEAFPGMSVLGNITAFKQIIGDITDVALLANAIFSQWRYITHWSMTDSLISANNKEWFCLAFARLAELTKDAPPLHVSIETITGDITTLDVDAIVNAANCGLLGGGGVDGEIHRAAGKELFEECLKLVEGLPKHRGDTGQAYLTKAGQLPCKYVIHTPGPVYCDGQHDEPKLLANCYENCLRRAEEMACTSIAFPCISTGVYGYPKKEAARIAIKTIQAFSPVSLQKVVFCCFEAGDAVIYKRILNEKKEVI